MNCRLCDRELTVAEIADVRLDGTCEICCDEILAGPTPSIRGIFMNEDGSWKADTEIPPDPDCNVCPMQIDGICTYPDLCPPW